MTARGVADADASTSDDRARGKAALQALDLLMDDMQAGSCAFLGVFLQQRGWTAGPIGTVMTTPAWAVIDHTGKKRLVVIVTGSADRDTIESLVRASDDLRRRGVPVAPGRTIHNIGGWPEHGLAGTQPGPDKNGRRR